MVQWEKKPGDHVELDDVVAVIETDKVGLVTAVMRIGLHGCALRQGGLYGEAAGEARRHGEGGSCFG